MGILSLRVARSCAFLAVLLLTGIAAAEEPSAPEKSTTYAVIPIFGPIGTEVTAAVLAEALAEVEAHDPEYLVLCFDTPGGYVIEMQAIAGLLEKHRHRKLVAFVKRGISCGAVLAMSCPTIVVYPDAAIGAALPWRQGPDGMPQMIEEKFQSVSRAEMRSLAHVGGHNDLLLRGMMEAELELVLVPGESGPQVLEKAHAPEAKVIKEKDRILTLTGHEAIECGLARATASNFVELRTALGVESWRRVGQRGWQIMFAFHQQQQARDQEQQRQIQRLRDFHEEQVREARRRVEDYQSLKNDLRHLDERIAEAQKEISAARTQLQRVDAEASEQARAVVIDYERKLADAEKEKRLKDRVLEKHEAKQEFQRRKAEVNTKYLPLIDEQQSRLDRATDRYNRLIRQRNELIADAKQ